MDGMIASSAYGERHIRGMLAVTDVDRAMIEREVAARRLNDVWQLCA